MKEVGPKNMHFFKIFEPYVSFFRFHQNKEKLRTVTDRFQQPFSYFCPFDEFHFSGLSADLKIKVGRRT